MSSNIEFKVGDRYENMKGIYEVLTIEGDSMRIRWENGEEISTPIELQQRIIARMESEKQKKAGGNAATSKNRKRVSAKYGSEFKGLQEADFKKNVKGSNWRSRNGLGGAVTARLRSATYTFNSWAVSRGPGIEWADADYRKRDSDLPQANFSVQVGDDHLYLGFYIERPDATNGQKSDWDAFMSWLKDAENEEWLNRMTHELGLCIDNHHKIFSEKIRPSGETWKLCQRGEDQGIGSLHQFLEALSADKKVDLHIGKEIHKDEVFTRGAEISDDISSVFNALMPLYEATKRYIA